MRAMVIPRFGGPEVFELWDWPKPSPAPGEILVHIVASGANPVDAKIRQHGTWAGITPPAVLGYDASGIVAGVGTGVMEFKEGDAVYYTPEIFGNHLGTYAEYNVVPARIVAPRPFGLSHIEAAAVPLAGGTAWEAVVRRLRIQVGETLLIHGGAGGVGSFAVQIAKAAGAYVLASAGPANQTALRTLGADVAIDYEHEDVAGAALRETHGRGVDAVFDTAGGNIIRSLPATRPFGRLATILGVEGDLTQLHLRNQTLHGIFLTRERERLERIGAVLGRDQVRPWVTDVLQLEQVSKAHERLDSGHGSGKIVLRVSNE
jgi:NADPH2:quinone reductase